MDILNGIGDRMFGLVTNEFKENGFKWLTRAKYTSMIASPILAGFGGWNACKEFEKRKKEKNVESLSVIETVKIVAKHEAGALISTVGAVAATAQSDKELKRKIDDLTTMVVIGNDKIREMQKAEKEVVGKEKSEEIQQKANKNLASEIDTRDMTRDIQRGILPALDTFTGQIFPPNSKAKFEAAITMVQRETIHDNVFYGQFVEACGGIWYFENREVCKVGSEYLWPENHNAIYDICIEDGHDKYGLPIYVITHPDSGGLTSKYELPWAVD